MRAPTREPIQFDAADGVSLRGEVTGTDGPILILVHEPGRDLDTWGAAPAWLAKAGFCVMAFDLRGHGASDGEVDDEAVGIDAEAAIGAMSARDAATIVIGAGSAAIGATAAAVRARADGLVLVSPVYGKAAAPIPPRVVLPWLAFMDPSTEDQLPRLHAVQSALIGWRMIVHAGASDAGSDMLSGSWALHAHEHIRAFARQIGRSR